jgi:putative membrane protein
MSDLHDPRVLFAAERTLLAWTRTSLTLMALGFAVERFSLFVRMLRPEIPQVGRGSSFVIGVALLLLGSLASLLSVLQYRRVVKTLNTDEIPQGYWIWLAASLNIALAICGVVLFVMLARQHF